MSQQRLLAAELGRGGQSCGRSRGDHLPPPPASGAGGSPPGGSLGRTSPAAPAAGAEGSDGRAGGREWTSDAADWRTSKAWACACVVPAWRTRRENLEGEEGRRIYDIIIIIIPPPSGASQATLTSLHCRLAPPSGSNSQLPAYFTDASRKILLLTSYVKCKFFVH